MLVFSLSGNCITAIMSFIAVFLQLFISLLCMGKDLFGILLFIIYVGAIAVLFLFVIMTTEVDSNVKIFKIYPDYFYTPKGSYIVGVLQKIYNSVKVWWQEFYVQMSLKIGKQIIVFLLLSIVLFVVFTILVVSFSAGSLLKNDFILSVYNYEYGNNYNVGWLAYSSVLPLSIKNYFLFYTEDWFFFQIMHGFSFSPSRMYLWCGNLFVGLWPVVYFSGFMLLVATIGVIDLVLPNQKYNKG